MCFALQLRIAVLVAPANARGGETHGRVQSLRHKQGFNEQTSGRIRQYVETLQIGILTQSIEWAS